jgi:2-succinyl-5-enolpyruvyl-6-hydroxy-3-cyclohexene-1-carboxylate synthase
MQYSDKRLAQELVVSLKDFQINQVVISPGSRNAPLIISLVDEPDIETFSIVDERAAGFFALGLAQQSSKPVALVCTSGSALLNYYPAISEAYYSKIPLVVLSADRPEHLIDIADGQTIRQKNVFQTHLGESFNFKESGNQLSLFHKAFRNLRDLQIPVHLNLPFDEPLYNTVLEINPEIREGSRLLMKSDFISEEIPLEQSELDHVGNIWNKASRKLILIGTGFSSELIDLQIKKLLEDPSVLIMCESLSNIHHPNIISKIDQLIFKLDESELKEFKPDIVLSFGGMLVSKKIKQILRSYDLKEHWHVDMIQSPDTFLSLTRHFSFSPSLFFSQLLFVAIPHKESEYQSFWLSKRNFHELRAKEYFTNLDYCDLWVFKAIFDKIPQNRVLQLANSSVVRYAQFFTLNDSIESFANRGTSGIDGSTSTAIGSAYARKDKDTIFISGDTSFLYDANGLWNDSIPKGLRIVVINNNGGAIFKIIPGPKKTKSLSYFVTPNNRSMEYLCKLNSISYQVAEGKQEVLSTLGSFFEVNEDSVPKLLEIKTGDVINENGLIEYFNYLNKTNGI